MRLDDMQRSDNVEDRRGFRPVHGFGIGTVVLLVVGYFMGVSPSTLMSLIGVGESVTQGRCGCATAGRHRPAARSAGRFRCSGAR